LVFFALLIQKDRGFGPYDVLASYSYPSGDMSVVLNPVQSIANRLVEEDK